MTENNRRFPAEWEKQQFLLSFHTMVKIGQENTSHSMGLLNLLKKCLYETVFCSHDGTKKEKVSDMLERAS
jgi:hypothetical protein